MMSNDPALDRSAYGPPQPSGTYDAFLRRNTALGKLKVQASRAQNALPTEGVRISVIGRFDDARVLFFDGITDADGLITNITLPAPPVAHRWTRRIPDAAHSIRCLPATPTSNRRSMRQRFSKGSPPSCR